MIRNALSHPYLWSGIFNDDISPFSRKYIPSFDEYGNKYDILSDDEVDESPTILHNVVRQPADEVSRSWLMDDGISKAAM